MFRKTIIIRGLVLLLTIGLLASLAWAGLQIAEKKGKDIKEEEQSATEKGVAVKPQEAQLENKRVLILHIFEENWDDLEFWPPKIEINSAYTPPTVKEVLNSYKKYKTKMMKLSDKRAVKTDEEVRRIKEGAINYIKFSLSKGYLPNDSVICVYHEIKYLGKIYELNDEDRVGDGILFSLKDKRREPVKAFRYGREEFNYSYKKIPEKISLLTDITNDPSRLESCEYIYIRLVKDIHIISGDELGNLKIKYNDRVYNLKAGEIVELPIEEKNLTKEEMEDFKKYYEKEWGERVNDIFWGGDILSPKTSFNFKTKVTLINYGYVMLKLK